MHRLWSALVLLAPLNALAQDAVRLEAVRKAQQGFGNPSLTLHFSVSGHATANLTCGPRSYGMSEGVLPSSKKTIELDGLPAGTHQCRGTLTLEAGDGTSGEMPLSFDVAMLNPLNVTVNREELDTENFQMIVRADRYLSRVHVEVFGEGGHQLGMGETSAGGMDTVGLEWNQQPGEALKLVVTAWDMDDLPGKVELMPWSYSIPHEDVVFATGSSNIEATENPKLQKAYDDLKAVEARYGSVVDVKLYVAGYTDTVGGTASNQVLSEARAKSIARWFRNRGFAGQVFFQGFGEEVLAITTPDETDAAQNRRAIYILCADTPVSPEVPRKNWTRLQ
ncbi:MAG: OmpA family protein [Proteobacteria bacterium]|jgi:outer membrane protein OmpA-like peptidoglycan-associated protein|nr:OmpA family protein [Pseudomonadota bacterium]